MDRVNQIVPVICELGEGCVWDERVQCLYFVDIKGFAVYSWNPGSRQLHTYQTDGPPGCLVPEADGTIAVAAGHTLIRLSAGLELESVLTKLDFPEHLRFNDGKCDPQGNWWIGTMAEDQKHPDAEKGGSLCCIRNHQVIADYRGYTIPNGLAWSRDGSLFYHIDTATGCIDVYDIDGTDHGKISGRRCAVQVEEQDGSPDGMCMDTEGNLWTAMWGGGKVICFHPETGKKLAEILVPAKHVSCVTFGDRDLKTLYITTAKDEMGQGGGLYSVRMPVAGRTPYRYGGEGNGT